MSGEPAHRLRLEKLLHAIEKHADAELEILPSYRDLAESTSDAVIEMIMNLILDDEERHHQLMRRIASRLTHDLESTDGESGVLKTDSAPADADVSAMLSRFVIAERSMAEELRGLALDAGGIYDSLLFELLTAMALDSAKHQHLMQFLLRHVGRGLSGEVSSNASRTSRSSA